MISYNIMYSILVLLLISGPCNAVRFCTQQARAYPTITQFGVEVQVTSPQYPNNYTTDIECLFAQITASFYEPFAFNIVQEVTACGVPYTVVGFNLALLPNQYSVCRRNRNGFIYKQSILKHIQSAPEIFNLKSSDGSVSSLNLTAAVYPLLSMEPTNSTVNLTTTPTAFITSHQGYPESTYSNDLHNILTLSDIPSGYDVVIEFVHMKIGLHSSCSFEIQIRDVFRMYIDEEINPAYRCGDYIGTSTPDPQQISSANSIRLEFTTDGRYEYDGFLLLVHRLPSNFGTSTTITLGDISIGETVKAKASTSFTSGISTISSTNNSSNLSYSDTNTHSATLTSDRSSSPSQPTSTPVSDGSTLYEVKLSKNEIIIAAAAAGSGGVLLLVIIVVLAFKLARHSSNGKHPDETLEEEKEVGDIHVRSKGTTPSAAAVTTNDRPEVAMMSGYSDVELSCTTAEIRHAAAVRLTEGAKSKTEEDKSEVTYASIQRPKGRTSKKESSADEGPMCEDINKGQTSKVRVVPNDAVYAAIDKMNAKRGNAEEKESAVMVDEIEMVENDLYGTT